MEHLVATRTYDLKLDEDEFTEEDFSDDFSLDI